MITAKIGDSMEKGKDNEIILTKVELCVESITNTLLRLERKMDNLDIKLDRTNNELNDRMWKNFYWTVGGFFTVFGLLARVLKWV